MQACGICHSDTFTREGTFPGIQYPRVPGHEVVGLIDAVGLDVRGWKPGQRVGVGWHGGQCGYCGSCRRGDFFACETATHVTGITSDGGYADYMVARAEAVALVAEANFAAALDENADAADRIAKGDAAIEKLHEGFFDVVVSDLKMGGSTGLDVLKTAKTLHPSTAVILMTAYGGVSPLSPRPRRS